MKLSTICMCGVLCIAAVSECSGMNRNTTQRRDAEEKKETADYLGNFNSNDSWAFQEFNKHFLPEGEKPFTKSQLVSISCVLAVEAKIPLPPRLCKRRREPLIKWLDDNWDAIRPIIGFITLGYGVSDPVTGELTIEEVGGLPPV